MVNNKENIHTLVLGIATPVLGNCVIFKSGLWLDGVRQLLSISLKFRILWWYIHSYDLSCNFLKYRTVECCLLAQRNSAS